MRQTANRLAFDFKDFLTRHSGYDKASFVNDLDLPLSNMLLVSSSGLAFRGEALRLRLQSLSHGYLPRFAQPSGPRFEHHVEGCLRCFPHAAEPCIFQDFGELCFASLRAETEADFLRE